MMVDHCNKTYVMFVSQSVSQSLIFIFHERSIQLFGPIQFNSIWDVVKLKQRGHDEPENKEEEKNQLIKK